MKHTHIESVSGNNGLSGVGNSVRKRYFSVFAVLVFLFPLLLHAADQNQWSLQDSYVGWQQSPTLALTAYVDFCNASNVNANNCQGNTSTCGVAGPTGFDCVFSPGTCTLTNLGSEAQWNRESSLGRPVADTNRANHWDFQALVERSLHKRRFSQRPSDQAKHGVFRVQNPVALIEQIAIGLCNTD